jgi:hypothetical protein
MPMTERVNSRGPSDSQAMPSLRYSHVRQTMISLFLAAALCSLAFAQNDPGQTVATIPSEDGELLVQNGKNNEVWLATGNDRFSVNAEEALRLAGWIKEGKTGSYGDTGPFRVRREANLLVVTLGSGKEANKEVRLGEAEALQFAAALASARQNVSEAGQ